ncbi:MAG: hypothetical protein ACRDSP_07450 [Pseudonocardiaceae bacterium]
MTRLPDDDDLLLVELSAALRSAGPITDRDLTQAVTAFTWRTVDDELALATLVYDSSIQDRPLIRGAVGPDGRTLIFEGDTLSVEVDATGEVLTGRVVPPRRADISLMTASGTADRTTTDDMGCFSLTGPASGPVRLLCRTATTRLVTDWVRL